MTRLEFHIDQMAERLAKEISEIKNAHVGADSRVRSAVIAPESLSLAQRSSDG